MTLGNEARRKYEEVRRRPGFSATRDGRVRAQPPDMVIVISVFGAVEAAGETVGAAGSALGATTAGATTAGLDSDLTTDDEVSERAELVRSLSFALTVWKQSIGKK